MFSYLARSSLVVTSRGYHIARAMTLARNVKPPQLSKYVLFRQVKPVTTSFFKLASDSSSASGADTSGILTFEDVERSLRDKDAIIIDVRKFEEAAELGQIPSAHVLPVDDIETAMRLSADEFKTKYGFSKPSPSGPRIIVYCRSGVRAGQAAKLFTEKFGFTSVFNYKGSWLDWSERHPEHVKQSPAGTTGATKK